MVITVSKATGEPVWKSPDGKVSIYDIVDQDGNKWSTKSHKLGKGVGQSFEVEVEQKNGKTYLRLPVDPNGPYAQNNPSQSAIPVPTSSAPAQSSSGSAQVFADAVTRFSEAVDRLAGQGVMGTTKAPDVVPTDINSQAIAEFFGGEIVDDLDISKGNVEG